MGDGIDLILSLWHFHFFSPYNGFNNSPITVIDPDGRSAISISGNTITIDFNQISGDGAIAFFNNGEKTSEDKLIYDPETEEVTRKSFLSIQFYTQASEMAMHFNRNVRFQMVHDWMNILLTWKFDPKSCTWDIDDATVPQYETIFELRSIKVNTETNYIEISLVASSTTSVEIVEGKKIALGGNAGIEGGKAVKAGASVSGSWEKSFTTKGTISRNGKITIDFGLNYSSGDEFSSIEFTRKTNLALTPENNSMSYFFFQVTKEGNSSVWEHMKENWTTKNFSKDVQFRIIHDYSVVKDENSGR